MRRNLNLFLDRAAEFLAHRKGLLPALGVALVIANGVLRFLPAGGWLAETDLLLHLGVILGLIGILLAWAL